MEKFDIITRLGKGACGAVYLVRDLKTRKLFALKKIQLDEGRKNRRRDAVIKEAKILSELKHPTIVTYYDSFFDEQEECLCILQDYCDGGTLEDKIIECSRKKEYFLEKQVIQWFIQIAMAVQFMHSKKILHRDLKTQNVFMTKTGMTCKLGDFGISKMMDATIDVASTCVGTPCYLSPEMCQDIPYSSKADVWALGCLLYEICAHKPAFDANNLISLFYKIVKGEFDAIPDVYSPELQDVLKTILTKSPDDRPSTRQVLGLPYIRQNLDRFITEKELVLQMKALNVKDPPAVERSPITNPLAEITNREQICARTGDSPKQIQRMLSKPRLVSAPPPICIESVMSPTSPKKSMESPIMSARRRVLPPIPSNTAGPNPIPLSIPGPTPTPGLTSPDGLSRTTSTITGAIRQPHPGPKDSGIDIQRSKGGIGGLPENDLTAEGTESLDDEGLAENDLTAEGTESLNDKASPALPRSSRGAPWLACRQCGQCFRMKSWLQKHMLKHGAVTRSQKFSGRDGDRYEDDYQDDFEAVSSDSDMEDEIPEDLPEGAMADSDNDDLQLNLPDDILYDYADDEFEEYASDEDLDMIVNHAREVQAYDSEEEGDETIVDDAPSGLINTCKNFIEQHCLQALGPDRFEQVKNKCDIGIGITEADLRHSVRRKVGSDHMETCYLLSELLSPDK